MKHTVEAYAAFLREAELTLGVEVFIAGGAVRDILLDRVEHLKDVDLWIYTQHLEKTRRLAVESGLFGERVRAVGHSEANLGRDGAIIAIDYFELNGRELNLIYIKEPTHLDALISDFDFGVNQAGIGSGGLRVTNAFEEARRRQVLRVTRKDSPSRAEQRLERMREKFPDWQVLDDLPPPPPRKAPPVSFGYS